MKKLLALVAVLFSLPATSADYSTYKELYMANEAGGDIVLTLEPCAIKEAKDKGFESRSYATEGNGAVHEGCWAKPGIEDAPQAQGITIIPLVNVYYDGIVLPFPQDMFGPEDHTHHVAVKGDI